MQFKLILNVWKEIFKDKKYIFLTLSVGFIFYLLNAFIVQWKNLPLISIVGIWNVLFLGVYSSITKITFINTILIGLLTGVLISLLAYRFNNLSGKRSNKLGFISSAGIFLGLFAPGCAACGIGLAATLGLGSSLVFLPFEGAELSFLAIGLLVFSIWRTTRSFIQCDI
jgi:hypothetical protein